MKYKLLENKDYDGKVTSTYIYNKEEGCYIPPHPGNSDYQEYLKWVSEGNTAEESD